MLLTMKAKLVLILLIPLVMMEMFFYRSKGKTETERNLHNTQDKISVYIKKDNSFLIVSNNNRTILKTKSKYKFLRQLTFISNTIHISKIQMHTENSSTPMIFFDDLLQDTTIINDINYEYKGDELLVNIKMLEFPYRYLTFAISL